MNLSLATTVQLESKKAITMLSKKSNHQYIILKYFMWLFLVPVEAVGGTWYSWIVRIQPALGRLSKCDGPMGGGHVRWQVIIVAQNLKSIQQDGGCLVTLFDIQPTAKKMGAHDAKRHSKACLVTQIISVTPSSVHGCDCRKRECLDCNSFFLFFGSKGWWSQKWK